MIWRSTPSAASAPDPDPADAAATNNRAIQKMSESDESLDARLVRELATVLNQTALSEIEFARGDLKIRVAKTLTASPVVVTAPVASIGPAGPQAIVEPSPAPPAPALGAVVKSPMVGTVYLQSQPGAPPFVRIGDRVTQGQTLLLIEAMKTMNPIAAPNDGVLLEMRVADGQPVEYGEPLAVIG
jgi:acetyl-CoA carboxylase biotin carboxyl carrier protein